MILFFLLFSEQLRDTMQMSQEKLPEDILDLFPSVVVENGIGKYVLMQLNHGNKKKLVLRQRIDAEFHRDAARSTVYEATHHVCICSSTPYIENHPIQFQFPLDFTSYFIPSTSNTSIHREFRTKFLEEVESILIKNTKKLLFMGILSILDKQIT